MAAPLLNFIFESDASFRQPSPLATYHEGWPELGSHGFTKLHGMQLGLTGGTARLRVLRHYSSRKSVLKQWPLSTGRRISEDKMLWNADDFLKA